jgi:hypothetical protein
MAKQSGVLMVDQPVAGRGSHRAQAPFGGDAALTQYPHGACVHCGNYASVIG